VAPAIYVSMTEMKEILPVAVSIAPPVRRAWAVDPPYPYCC
jgi:hypothetical protein